MWPFFNSSAHSHSWSYIPKKNIFVFSYMFWTNFQKDKKLFQKKIKMKQANHYIHNSNNSKQCVKNDHFNLQASSPCLGNTPQHGYSALSPVSHPSLPIPPAPTFRWSRGPDLHRWLTSIWHCVATCYEPLNGKFQTYWSALADLQILEIDIWYLITCLRK